MGEVERIEEQLRRAYVGGAWHGSSVSELLKDVSAAQAAAKPLADAHSIAEIVLHIAAWERAARRRLQGERAELSTEEDWPLPSGESEAAWRETLLASESANRELRAAILSLDDADLDRPIVEGMSSRYVTLHGVIQHSLYHAGQIAILKKALE